MDKFAFRKALTKAKITVQELADILGITRQAVDQWVLVPPRHVLKVESYTKIPRQRLRPDLYPNEQ